MKLTKAQNELLAQLENGCEITLKEDYYTVIGRDGKVMEKIWPSTFYGLFDALLIERGKNGNYVISDAGRSAV